MPGVKTQLIEMGDSRGVCIPETLLKQSGLTNEVLLTVHAGGISIESALHPRVGWEARFRAAQAPGGDEGLLDPETLTEWDEAEWEWEW